MNPKYSIFILFIFINSFLFQGAFVSALAEDDLICDICNEEISEGEYIILGDSVYHKHCFDKTPKCPVCGHPVIDNYEKDHQGRFFHYDCYHSTAKCSYCNKLILKGKYVVTEDGRTFHRKCYQKAPKCGLCQSPLGDDSVEINNRRYHRNCYENAVKCDVCNDPIFGKYQIDIYGRNICSKHLHHEKCSVCEFPQISKRLNDGRGLCDRCSKSAIYNESLASRLFQKVRQDLVKELGLKIDHDIEFQLIGRDKLNQLDNKASPSMLGKFLRQTKTLNIPLIGSKTIDEQFTIYILYGLPKKLFQSVVAHELTHAWQALNCSQEQSTELKEGTAELVAFLYLQNRNEQIWMDRIENNEENLYRENFKKAFILYEKLGHKDFFKEIRTLTHF